MKKNYVLIPLVITLFLSCGAPFYYERAEIKKGLSGGIGVGGSACDVISDPGPGDMDHIGPDKVDYCLAGMGSVFIRQGFSDKLALFIQGNVGVGKWLTNDNPVRPIAVYGDGQIGLKFKSGEKGAIKISVGATSLVDIVYLYDNNNSFTTNVGVGFRGLNAGFTYHTKLSDRFLSHLTMNVSGPTFWSPVPVSFSMGLGIEAVPVYKISQVNKQRIKSEKTAIFLQSLAAVGGTFLLVPIAPVGAAIGATLIGNQHYDKAERGSFWWSTFGAFAGTAAGALAYVISGQNKIVVFPAVCLPGVGAVLGYHWSRPKLTTSQGFLNHFELPSLGIRPEKTEDGKTITAVDFKLINARF